MVNGHNGPINRWKAFCISLSLNTHPPIASFHHKFFPPANADDTIFRRIEQQTSYKTLHGSVQQGFSLIAPQSYVTSDKILFVRGSFKTINY